MAKEYEPAFSELKTLYSEILTLIDNYINSFSDLDLLSFSITKEKSKEKVTKYYMFSLESVKLLEKADSVITNLTPLLYEAYEKNDNESVKIIGEALLRQDEFKKSISDFMGSCEKEISQKDKIISIQALYRSALVLKQKIKEL